MITFTPNGRETSFSGDEDVSLLNFLRNEKGVTSIKDRSIPRGLDHQPRYRR